MKRVLNWQNIPNKKVAALAGVLRERDYQDAKWGTVEENPHDVPGWILIIRREIREAEEAWATKGGDADALCEILQVAATCVACLEQHGTIERILNQSAQPQLSLCRKCGERPQYMRGDVVYEKCANCALDDIKELINLPAAQPGAEGAAE